jgi:hypothetical protein
MKSLYILVSSDRTLFKIGIGDDPALRWKQLRGDFCEADSYYFSVSKSAFRVEAMLHTLFSEFNKRRPGNGGSEWFDSKCLPEVEVFLAKCIDTPFAEFGFNKDSEGNRRLSMTWRRSALVYVTETLKMSLEMVDLDRRLTRLEEQKAGTH